MANAVNQYSALVDKDADLRSEMEELRLQVSRLKLSLGEHVELVDKQLVILGKRIDEGNSNFKECLATEKAEIQELYKELHDESHAQNQQVIEETRNLALECIEETKDLAKSHMSEVVREKLKECDAMCEDGKSEMLSKFKNLEYKVNIELEASKVQAKEMQSLRDKVVVAEAKALDAFQIAQERIDLMHHQTPNTRNFHDNDRSRSYVRPWK